ncbi:MAG: helix-turn-helix domain-containing protein [Polaromonas sp.]|nr:helix-turn-helix domain-containing protein [Polaromonas sp.]
MDAANRIFGCLEALDSAERPLSLNELQREVACPVSTLAVTLRTLVQLGYVHHDRSTRTYSPTVLLAGLGAWVATRFAPPAELQQAARAISVQTELNVIIGHRNDIRVQYVDFIPGKDMEHPVRAGTTRLLCRSALGWALLTYYNARAVESIVRRTNASLPTEDSLELESILALVERGRRDGFVRSENVLRIGYGMIAMPVPHIKQQMAIGVSGKNEVLARQEAHIVEVMNSALNEALR